MRKFIALLVGLVFAATVFAADAPPTVLSWQVVDSDGKPVADAEVGVWKFIRDESTRRFDRTVDTRSDADGKFSFSMAKDEGVLVAARKDGLALGFRQWYSRNSPGLASVLTLMKPAVLAGVVVDEQGQPIAGATVRPMLQQGHQYMIAMTGFDWLPPAQTDDQGRFSFKNVPADALAGFAVTAPGKANTTTVTNPQGGPPVLQYHPGQADIKIVLQPESCITGRVIEKSTSLPAAGVILQAADKAGRFMGLFGGYSATSGADGRFDLKGLHAGLYELVLVSPNPQVSPWVIKPVKVELTAGQTKSDVEVEAAHGGVLEVRVVSAQSGQPVPNVYFGVRPVEPLAEESTLGNNDSLSSDAQGLARLRLPAGQYVFQQIYTLNDSDFGTVSLTQTVTMVEGRTEHLEVKLPAKPKLAVTVKDASGQPAAGAEVRLLPNGPDAGSKTDSAGRTELPVQQMPGMPGDREPVMLLARSADRNLVVMEQVDDAAKTVELKLGPALTLSGTVVDAAGRPVPGVGVTLILETGHYGFGFNETDLKTDAQGRYQITGLPPDEKYFVQVNSENGRTKANQQLGSGGVFLEPSSSGSQTVAVDQIVLVPADGSISGSVVDTEGQPMAKVEVRVGEGYSLSPGVQKIQPTRRVTTDDQGRFKLEGLCLGRVDVNCWQTQSYGRVAVNVTDELKDVKDVTIVLKPQNTGGGARPAVKLPPSLVGKPLSESEKETYKDKAVLFCFWDYSQKPSRHAVQQLIRRAADLDRQGLAVQLFWADTDDPAQRLAVQTWLEKMNCPKWNKLTINYKPTTAAAKAEGPFFAWGVRGLPWFILADKSGTVRAEGFSFDDLDAKLKALAAP